MISKRRISIAFALTVPLLLVLALPAAAGSPHFTALTVEREGDLLVIEGKEAGLGDEENVNIKVTATAACVNGGGKKPKAANKTALSEDGDFPATNGKAEFILILDGGEIEPSCSPQMEIVFSNVTVEDVANNLKVTFPGTF